jgi:hypothetical protein
MKIFLPVYAERLREKKRCKKRKGSEKRYEAATVEQ